MCSYRKIRCESLLPVANCCKREHQLTDKSKESESYQFAQKNLSFSCVCVGVCEYRNNSYIHGTRVSLE